MNRRTPNSDDVQAIGAGSTVSGPGDLKLLNPLVAGIGDVEMAVAVEGHAVPVDELAGVAAGTEQR